MTVEGSLYHAEVVNEKGLSGVSFIRGNEQLALGVSSSLVKGAGTNAEQLIGLTVSTCFNGTLELVERSHNLPHKSVIHTGVDMVKDGEGYAFILRIQILMEGVAHDQAEALVEEAKDRSPLRN